ncbi:hypothetical protein BDN72DRAFT_962204 [Pluteus cervinus]|uniref:Uncharacterized protein n=1 Tax=Pluteus cervinus TaxID=181527 RepID=A0ACD3AJQ8_9AGAR|nr:hypothetical protein BDN72DRAFT_962204 [Pluteus cervinus]
MPSRTNPTRLPLFGLMVALYISFWGGRHMVLAAPQNVTIDDSNQSIIFSPPSAWHNSSDMCSSCLSVNPAIASNASFNQAVNPDEPSGEESDSEESSSQSAPQNPASTVGPGTPVAPVGITSSNLSPVPSSSVAVAPAAASTASSTAVAGDTGVVALQGQAHSHGSDDHASSKRRIQSINRRSMVSRGADPDDPNFVSVPITMQFNFTGTAVYLFGIQPSGPPPSSNTTTNTNLTFTIDGQNAGQNIPSSSTQTTLTFQPNTLVYQNTDLSDGPHSFLVTVGANSVFLFDYLIYTFNSSASGTNPVGTHVPLMASAVAVNNSNQKHNTITFAAAVGGSVGVLSLVALGLALNIIRRRRLSARRDRLTDGDSLHTNGSEDTPRMMGPAPFIPRYFPGTRIPTDPPPYEPSLSSLTSPPHTRNHILSHPRHGRHVRTQSIQSTDEDGLSGPYAGRITHPIDRSYADIPPSSTPPLPEVPLDDLGMDLPPPPPPFGVAIATPAPIGLNLGGLPPPTLTSPRLRISASSPNFSADTSVQPPLLPPPPHSTSGHGSTHRTTASQSSSPSSTAPSSRSSSPPHALLPSTLINQSQIPQPPTSSSVSDNPEVDQISHNSSSNPTRSSSSISGSTAPGNRTTNSVGASVPSLGATSASTGTGTTAVSTQSEAGGSPAPIKTKKTPAISSLFRVRGRGSSSSSAPAVVPTSSASSDLPAPLPQAASTNSQRPSFMRHLRRGNSNNNVGGEQGSTS